MTSVWVGGIQHDFPTLREALLFCWDRGPENIEKVVDEGRLIQIREEIWKR